MRTGFLDIPPFPLHTYNTTEKSGSRIEFSLRLSDEFIELGRKISDLPLKYVSLMKARASNGNDQEFHQDSSSGERAILYLTDVLDEAQGPIEFQKYGKILGKSGTYVHYSADEVHRGCSSITDRYALALAFDESSNEIRTIGGPENCSYITCPSGSKKKAVLPTTGEISETTCCEQDNKLITIAIFTFSIIAIWYIFFI
jgi:hypothetical protein